MPNIVSKHRVLAELVTSAGTWLKARGWKDSHPFTQRVVQQATDVRLQ